MPSILFWKMKIVDIETKNEYDNGCYVNYF